MAKIVILTSVHSAFDDRIFHKQARSLAKADYEVVLIAPHSRNEIVDGVRVVSLPEQSSRPKRIFGLTFRILCFALREKADFYHFHDPELIPTALLIKMLTRAKIIYDMDAPFFISRRE